MAGHGGDLVPHMHDVLKLDSSNEEHSNQTTASKEQEHMMQNINTAYRSDVKVKSKFKKDIETILLAKKAEQKIVKDEIAELRLSERLVYIEDPSYEDKTRDNEISDTGTNMKRQVIQTPVPLLPHMHDILELDSRAEECNYPATVSKGHEHMQQNIHETYREEVKVKSKFKKDVEKILLARKAEKKILKDEIAKLRLDERLVYINDPSNEDKTRDNQMGDTRADMKRQVIQTPIPLLPQMHTILDLDSRAEEYDNPITVSIGNEHMIQNINTAHRSNVKVKSKFKNDIENIILAKKPKVKYLKSESADLKLDERISHITNQTSEKYTHVKHLKDTSTDMIKDSTHSLHPSYPIKNHNEVIDLSSQVKFVFVDGIHVDGTNVVSGASGFFDRVF